MYLKEKKNVIPRIFLEIHLYSDFWSAVGKQDQWKKAQKHFEETQEKKITATKKKGGWDDCRGWCVYMRVYVCLECAYVWKSSLKLAKSKVERNEQIKKKEGEEGYSWWSLRVRKTYASVKGWMSKSKTKNCQQSLNVYYICSSMNKHYVFLNICIRENVHLKKE